MEIKPFNIAAIVAEYKETKNMKHVAKLFGLGTQKVRKILITNGVIFPERTRQIMLYRQMGLNDADIAARLNINIRTMCGYLPYSKTIYNKPNKSDNAKRISKWRAKK